MNSTILLDSPHGEIPIDIYQKLANDRILFLCDYVDDKLASDIVATFLLKDAEGNEKITLVINSEGGDIRNILMIYDMMQMVQSPIETVCVGSAMDEIALILAAGTPGMRLATKNSLISINQLVNEWSARSDLVDAKKALDQHMSDNKKMMEALATCTQKKYKQVVSDFDRRVFMDAGQAMKYGIIDKVVTTFK